MEKKREAPIPKKEWERHYEMNPQTDSNTRAGKEWNARPAKDRPHTHIKVNECDH
jgi:hypothetical protein